MGTQDLDQYRCGFALPEQQGRIIPATARLQVIEIYNQRWAAERNGGLYSEHDTAPTNPLLDDMIQILASLHHPVVVVEGGAGSGKDSISIAKQLPQPTDVRAVETSKAAISRIQDKLAADPHQFREGTSVTPIAEDIFDYIGGLEPGSVDAFYAHSVLHFLSPEDREELLRILNLAQKMGDVVAVSFKTHRDSLVEKGEFTGQDEYGIYRADEKGQERLFVGDNPQPIINEFNQAGYSISAIVPFKMKDYDGPGTIGDFSGFRAHKVA